MKKFILTISLFICSFAFADEPITRVSFEPASLGISSSMVTCNTVANSFDTVITRGHKEFMAVNISITNTIYFGGSSVTSGTGTPLYPRESVTFRTSSDNPVYFVSDANTEMRICDVR